MIDISGISKANILSELYNSARSLEGKLMSIEEAEKHIEKEGLEFDYLNGRAIKANLSGDKFDPYLYDRDNGEGVAKIVIENIGEVKTIDSNNSDLKIIDILKLAASLTEDHAFLKKSEPKDNGPKIMIPKINWSEYDYCNPINDIQFCISKLFHGAPKWGSYNRCFGR